MNEHTAAVLGEADKTTMITLGLEFLQILHFFLTHSAVQPASYVKPKRKRNTLSLDWPNPVQLCTVNHCLV